MACAANCARFLFFAFNFIFWVLGIAVLGIGIYSRIETKDYEVLFTADELTNAANLLIAAGVIVAIIGFMGCCGAWKKYQWMLIVYCILVILIFIIEIAAGALAYNKRDKVEKSIEDGIKKGLNNNYGKTDSVSKGITKAVDKIQKQLKCCGAGGANDWTTSWWKTNNVVANKAVPASCCLPGQPASCNDAINNSTMYNSGCVAEGKQWIKDNLWLIGGVGIGIAVVELLAILFAACLIHSFKSEKETTA